MSTHTSGGALTRRQAITAAVAAAVIPTSTVASTIDPHPAWLEELHELNRISADLPIEGQFPDTIDDLISDLIDLIAHTPAVTPEGIAAKVKYVRQSDGDHEETILDQLEAFLGALS